MLMQMGHMSSDSVLCTPEDCAKPQSLRNITAWLYGLPWRCLLTSDHWVCTSVTDILSCTISELSQLIVQILDPLRLSPPFGGLDGIKSAQIFLPFCHNARVWQTGGQTEFSSLDCVCMPCSTVKTSQSLKFFENIYILVTIRYIKILYVDVIWLILPGRLQSRVFPIHLLTCWRRF